MEAGYSVNSGKRVEGNGETVEIRGAVWVW